MCLVSMPASPPPGAVDFRDIHDPAAFVHGNINHWAAPNSKRGRIAMSDHEREELHAEGMAILCKLARDYKPQMAGYSQEGRFSGYAAMFLPRKLGDAWHRLHDNHQLETDPETGKRRWRYRERSISLELMTAEESDRHPVLIDHRETALDLAPQVRRALDSRWAGRREAILDVAGQLGQGHGDRDRIAWTLGLTVAHVQSAVDLLVSLAGELERTDGELPLRERVGVVIDVWWCEWRETVVNVADLLSEGATWADATVRLGLEAGQVRCAVGEIMLVTDRLRSDA